MTAAPVAVSSSPTSPAETGPLWVGHAGLAALLPAGAAVSQTLLGAISLGVDWLEVDVCATADGTLLLLHDTRLPSGRTVARLTASQVRRELPWALTLDEGVELIAGRVPLLLDIKTPATVAPLGRWAAGRADHARLAVCTENADALRHLRGSAPRVARWRSLPDVGSNVREHVARVSSALRSASSVGHIRDDLGVVLTEPGGRTRTLAARLTAALFRHQLPARLGELAADVGASALCVEQWTVTPELCDAAHRLDLELAAWTVNDAVSARRVTRCGVDMITTDEVARMRRALTGVEPRLRVVPDAAPAGLDGADGAPRGAPGGPAAGARRRPLVPLPLAVPLS